jgi:mRNA-degrading endonuclease RelE of RelBE toxin-antitoxin system
MIPANVIRTPAFLETYQKLPRRLRRIVDNKIEQLANNPSHRSLKAHRMRRARGEDVWSCYISINKRLLYQYKGGSIYLWDIGDHAVVDRVHLRRFG